MFKNKAERENIMEAVYRHDLLKIKEKLDAAGIKTREIKMV